MSNLTSREQQRENFAPCASQSGPEEDGENQHESNDLPWRVSFIRRRIIIFKDRTGFFEWILLFFVLVYTRKEHSFSLMVQKPCIGKCVQVEGVGGRPQARAKLVQGGSRD